MDWILNTKYNKKSKVVKKYEMRQLRNSNSNERTLRHKNCP